MLRIATARDCRIVLDESAVRSEQQAAYADAGDRWIANVRVSKMGGLARSLQSSRWRADAAFPSSSVSTSAERAF